MDSAICLYRQIVVTGQASLGVNGRCPFANSQFCHLNFGPGAVALPGGPTEYCPAVGSLKRALEDVGMQRLAMRVLIFYGELAPSAYDSTIASLS